MKKFILTTLAAAAFSANAVEVGINGFETARTAGQSGAAVTVGTKVDSFDVVAGFGRVSDGSKSFDRWTATLEKKLTKVGPVKVEGRAGAAYINNPVTKDGVVPTAGLGLEMPVTKNIKAVAFADHQFGRKTVAHTEGNILAAGVTVGF